MLPEIPNYTLLKKLGAGAFAEVWLAEHRINRRRVAIKILKESIAAGSDAEALFLREGEVLASFNQRNIVTIYDNARVGEHAWLIMELLPGGSLLDRMQAQGLEVGEAIGHVVQIAAALDAAHQRGVIHRDLKPANIMLRDETTPVLTDFGASRMLERSTIYGRDGGVVGTPQYMSPEQITGQPLDGRSDLYALGVMFHELLTGRSPFTGGSLQEVLAQHLHAPLPRLPDNLAVLEPLLHRLLAKDRTQRFASGAELIAALRRCFLDEQSLRTLIRFPPTSAWSSQLKALGFDLDTAQRTEVRIAQGAFLKEHVATQPLAAPPALPIPPPRGPEQAPAGSALPDRPVRVEPRPGVVQPAWLLLLLRASANALALSVLLAWGCGILDLAWASEAVLFAGMLPLLVHALAAAWIARNQRRYVLMSALLLLVPAACVSLYMGWYWLTPDRNGVELWLPATLLAALLLGVWLLAVRLGRWKPALCVLAALVVGWGALIALGDLLDDAIGWLLPLPILATALLWAWHGWARLGWAGIRFEGRAPRAALFGVLGGLLLPGAAAAIAQWLDWRQLEQALAGRWYGVSGSGRVMVELEAGGGMVQYGTQDGEQRPWLGRWRVTPPDRGSSLIIVEGEHSGLWLAATPLSGVGAEALDLGSYFGGMEDPTPWILQRSELLRVDPALIGRWQLACGDSGTLGLALQADGTGSIWSVADAPGPQGPTAALRWLTPSHADTGGSRIVSRIAERQAALPLSGVLAGAGAALTAELRFAGGVRRACGIAAWR